MLYFVGVHSGEMAERLKAVVLKTIVEFSLPGVRIPLSPLRNSQARFASSGEVPEWTNGAAC